MLNTFGELECGLPVLLVHVQKSVNLNMSGTVQDMMRKLQIKMKETAEAEKRRDLTWEERLKITNEEGQNKALLEDLTEMINKKTEETKENKEEKDEQQETNVTKVTSKPFDFIEDIFPVLSNEII